MGEHWGRKGVAFYSHPVLILKQGQAFRRRFWIGSLAETEALTVTFNGERGTRSALPQHHVPADGGSWFIDVNGTRFPVRDTGGWDFHRARGAGGDRLIDVQWAHRFEVPLACLREHEWNSVAIGSTGSGSEFLRFGGISDWVLPEETCWLPRVRDDHGSDLPRSSDCHLPG